MSNIAIADTHTLCLEALCGYIRAADQSVTVRTFSDYKSLKEHAAAARGGADVVLVARDLPGFEPLHFSRDFDGSKVGVIVSVQDEDKSPENIHGIFPKSLSGKAFLGGIQDLLAGKTFFPRVAFEARSQDERAFAGRSPKDFALTAREKEVLLYLLKGASNKDIARAINLQVVTVKLHVRGICRKLKAANRTQAALIAKESGWG